MESGLAPEEFLRLERHHLLGQLEDMIMACALVLTEMGYEYDDALIRHLVFAGEFTIEDFHATGSTHEERTDRYMFARGVNHSITALVTHMQEIHEEGKKKGRW